MADTVLDHPQLGPLAGVLLSEGGIQFRNLLYATIPQRWQHSIIVDDLREHGTPGKPYDATCFGPMAPQPDGSINFDFGLIQKTLPIKHEIAVDEENYRLGLLGAVASAELTPAAEAGNSMFNDQANALRWIKRHVAGFGGDPENVTIMGESAGAISLWMQFLKGEPLFSRGIVMSGDTHLRLPQPLERGELIYQAVLRELKADSMSTAERVALLRSLPWHRFVALPQNKRCYPTISGGFDSLEWSPEKGRAQIMSSLKWCKTLVIGDCELDATAMLPTLHCPDAHARLRACLEEAGLLPEEVDEIFAFYKIDQQTDSIPDSTAVNPGIVELASDIRFHWPVIVEGRMSANANVHVYHFHEPNPFDGPFVGRAGHVLDIAYTLQTYKHLLPPESQRVSEAMGLYVIGVAHGDLDNADGKPTEAPVTSAVGNGIHNNTSPAKSVLVWDTEHNCQVLSAEEYDHRFRHHFGQLLDKIDVTKIIRGLDLFQGWAV
ncbi:hypothetical protein SCUCBS95973_003173 [Sporothrix curviconia]|uniref:Carboxylic ester hydrolase n=1 Tax=Sporothrix curviconia TaxID=1260050 RepID=A0ABP0BD69_9PEZI